MASWASWDIQADDGGFRGGAKAYDNAVDDSLAEDGPVPSSTWERESGGSRTAVITLTAWMEGSGCHDEYSL